MYPSCCKIAQFVQLFWCSFECETDGHIKLPYIPCLHAVHRTEKKEFAGYSACVSDCWRRSRCICAVTVTLVALLCCHLLCRARTGQSTGTAAPRKGTAEEEGRRRQFDTWADQGTGSSRCTAFAYFVVEAFCYNLFHTIYLTVCVLNLYFVNESPPPLR